MTDGFSSDGVRLSSEKVGVVWLCCMEARSAARSSASVIAVEVELGVVDGFCEMAGVEVRLAGGVVLGAAGMAGLLITIGVPEDGAATAT